MADNKRPENMARINTPELAQAFITEHYYTCTDQILAGLGQMYAFDERFRKTIDQHATGTAAYICEAIEACCK